MPDDLMAALQRRQAGTLQASGALAASTEAARSSACRFAFVRQFTESAQLIARQADEQSASGMPLPPLAGLSISVKDLFDVAGHPTTAASASLESSSAAQRDSAVVARLRAAGACLIGHTNMTEFAFSGLGINAHHGTPPNPVTHALDGVARIPGGSSSGAAVSVATGAAWAALGTDTGGSIRIPAAFQGLVGFKNTAALTPREGCIPLSTSLDTACAITRSVRDAVLMHELLAARRVTIDPRPLRVRRLAVVTEPLLLDGMDATVARAFDRSLRRLRQQGAQIDEIALPSLAGLSLLQAQGGLVAAEAWAWHRNRMQDLTSLYDPRVATRIQRGATISAADYIAMQQARAAWICAMQAELAGYDALLCPTVPIVAPELATLEASLDAYMATNALVLRNPAVVNMLDGCAISLPCHMNGELPVGLMLWNAAGHDDRLLSIALQAEAALAAGVQ
ncbi:amidase [Pelomonas sp. SE-A7]|uniref:amidase n=1 Tax=Pelomonas sp. SE-A7 TaxID=3054953 RepID=UPI00259D0A37|nr:amidase [Pelomonas sp. SE-A7]MDM4767374.1 amidase [Pelomonas sp. SE-A7]